MEANKVPGARAALVGNEAAATLARQHNDANVHCLSGLNTPADAAKKIVNAFLEAKFEGGRHDRRVAKMEPVRGVAAVDPQVARVLQLETKRQQENIELIASENFTSPAVMEATGSSLTNK